jgi:hypothetical protein
MSPTTQRLYAAAQQSFADWCRQRGLSDFPLPKNVAAYLSHCAESRGAYAAAQHLSAIARLYRENGRGLDTKSAVIQDVISQCRQQRT